MLQADELALSDRGYEFELVSDAAGIGLVIRDFPLPPGYVPRTATLLVRLPPGYPDIPPDMFWLDPPVSMATGRPIRGAQVREEHLGRLWQRFSRHIGPGQWRSSDSIVGFLALIRRDLEDETRG